MNIITNNMPNNCIECYYKGFCLLPSYETEKHENSKHNKCPLIEKIEVQDIEQAFQSLLISFNTISKAMLQFKDTLEQLDNIRRKEN